jgi:hypothetical protein
MTGRSEAPWGGRLRDRRRTRVRVGLDFDGVIADTIPSMARTRDSTSLWNCSRTSASRQAGPPGSAYRRIASSSA